MNSQKLLDNLNTTIDSLTSNLKNHQLEDGGFKGFHLFDNNSGIWSTCETLHILMKVNSKLTDKEWIINATKYISSFQNSDGGWGFRGKGKSIVDITAWACLSLSHFSRKKEILNGIDFLLSARKNSTGIDNGGWGLTTFEPDRIYSTWIVCNCLTRILNLHNDWFDKQKKEGIYLAIKESQEWIVKSKCPNGGWGSLGDESTTLTSSAIALISIFSHGQDPRGYKDTFNYIKENSTNSLWQLEREIVVTQEGYELTQEWFTSIYCFRSYILS